MALRPRHIADKMVAEMSGIKDIEAASLVWERHKNGFPPAHQKELKGLVWRHVLIHYARHR